MLEIDGSIGEGGGQVLRTSLSLSVITGQPFRIANIRHHRSKPGLMAQHLKAVDASAAISHASVSGASLGSSWLEFTPAGIHSGRYKFDIGTAGSVCLVLQTILIPLSTAPSASTVIITGGTHVPWSPTYHYLELNWKPLMHSLGYNFSLNLDRAGFYPQGGGRISATIRHAGDVHAIQLDGRKTLCKISGISAVANLDISIAERQKRQALGRLARRFPDLLIKILDLPAASKGTFLLLAAEYESGSPGEPARCCFSALGELGKPAERVADEAVDALETYLQADVAVDQFLADQIMLPLSLAKAPSTFTTRITHHILTNAQVIQQFVPVKIEITGAVGDPGQIHIQPSSSVGVERE